MEHDPPIAAPEPRERMILTGGFCPEQWRWRVASVSPRQLVLASGDLQVRLHPDQWLPFLAARCRMDPVYIDATRIVPPAAAPLWLPGETPIEALTAVRPPRQNRLTPQHVPEDWAVRLHQAEFLLATAQIKAASLFDQGTIVTFAERGSAPVCSVTYDVRDGAGPLCTCQPVGRGHSDHEVCAHGLAALMRDRRATAMLARVLAATPPLQRHCAPVRRNP